MKTLLIFPLLFLCHLLNAQQPQWLNPKPFGGEIYDIEFFDTNRGFMVGRFGNIAKTTDGAQTWQLTNTGTSSDLWDIEICGPQSAIIRCDTFLLRTDDGGNTFTPIGSLNGGWFYSEVSMLNLNLGCASCQDHKYNPQHSKFGVTHDGGLTWVWSDFQSFDIEEVHGLRFADSLHGVAIIERFAGIYGIQTLDGGLTWTQVVYLKSMDGMLMGAELSYAGNGVFYIAFCYYEQQDYRPTLRKSIDYGTTWSALTFDPGSLVAWSGLKCLGDSIVIAAGSYYAGKKEKEVTSTAKNIYISTDAGATWYKGTKPTGISINNIQGLGIRTATDAYIWTSNYDNMELFTAHNLSDFAPETGTYHAFIKDLQFNGNTWYMLSGTSDGNINSTLYKSENAGITWDTVSSDISSHYYYNATMFGLMDGYGLIAGIDDQRSRVYRTIDGGLTWTESLIGQHFAKALNVFGYGASYFMESGDESNVFFSSNCGLTWQNILKPDDSLNHMHFITPDTGFLFGGGKTTANGGYYVTQNAGQAWEFHDLSIACLTRGQMLSATQGYVAASSNRERLYYINNDVAQLVFEADSLHSITDFAFSDSNHGYLIITKSPLYSSERSSKIHYTDDGGQTWLTYGPYSMLNGVKTFFNGNGYTYGDYGVLLQLGKGFPGGQTTLPSVNMAGKTWPNPASTGLQIALPSFAQSSAKLAITNVSGALVIQQEVSGQVVNVNINSLPAGFYLYTITNATNKVSGKFVVQ